MLRALAALQSVGRNLSQRIGLLVADRSANVAVIFAVTLPLVLGASALVGEYGNALVTEAENQRVADMAAYAGAIAYSKTSSEADMVSAARKIAGLNGVASAGVVVTLVPSPRGSGNNAVRAQVNVDNPLYLAPILGVPATIRVSAMSFAEVGGAATGCIIALDGSLTGVTLSGGTGITATDCEVASNATVTVPCGTSITAMAVSYNSASAPSQPCGGISGPVTKKETADPFAGNAGVAEAVARFTTLSGQTSPTDPTLPALAAIASPPTGLSIDFGYNESSTKAQAVALGCTAAKSGSTWTLTCPAGGTYNINALTLGGGLNLDFNLSASATYTFFANAAPTATVRFGPGNYLFNGNFTSSWGSTSFGAANIRVRGNLTTASTTTFGDGDLTVMGNLTTAGTTVFGAGARTVNGNLTTAGTTTFGDGATTVMGNLTTAGTTTFGAGAFSVNGTLTTAGTTKVHENGSGGTYTFVKGINTGGGSTTIFGSGTFKMGRSTASCSGAGYFSVCNTSTLTLKGPSVFELSSGINNTGGSTLTLGQGTTNSFKIGAASTGDAFFGGGGAKTYFADALGVSSVFQMGGHFNGSAGGGSCIVVSAAAEHDIKGNMSMAGGVVMGAGRYTINGYYALGATGGGASNCAGETVAVKAEGVTIVVSGSATPPWGDCAGKAFCATAGYNNIRLTAPTSGSMAGFAVIGPSANTNGALFTGGASGGRISGAFYFPRGPINMNGGAGVSGGTDCLQLVGSLITLAGGTTAVSECVSTAGSGGGGTPRLVQ